MNLVRWNNQPGFSGMFNNFFDNELDFSQRKESRCTPRTNIIENDNAFMLEFAVSGMSKKEFKINLENNLLSVTAEIEDKKNGILSVTLPKKDADKMKISKEIKVA